MEILTACDLPSERFSLALRAANRHRDCADLALRVWPCAFKATLAIPPMDENPYRAPQQRKAKRLWLAAILALLYVCWVVVFWQVAQADAMAKILTAVLVGAAHLIAYYRDKRTPAP